MIDKSPKNRDSGDIAVRWSIRHNLRVIFFCMTALPFFVFAFVYFRIGVFNTALAGFLIAMALILMLEGFIVFRKMVEHIERLSTTMAQAEEGKAEKIQDGSDTRELSLIAETFNRTLSKLQEATRDLGVKSVQASTMNEIREILSKSIRMEEVARLLLEKAIRAVNAQAGYLAVKREGCLKLEVMALLGIPREILREIDLDQTLAGLTLRERSPIIIEDIEKEEQWKDLNRPDMGVPRLLYLSVTGKDMPIGIIALGRGRENHPFQEGDIQFLQTLLQQVAYNLENARLYQNLEQSKKELETALVSQKKAQDHLLVSARMAAFGEITINIANELNNPLTSILGYADLILGSNIEESDTKEYLELIRNQAVRAGEITRGLLDLVGPQQGKKVLMDLNEIVKRSLMLVQSKLASKDIRVEFNLTKPLPLVLVDPPQMAQVFLNLMSNAVNAMTGIYNLSPNINKNGFKRSEKPRLLRIKSGQKDGRIYIAIQDNGCGISSNDFSRIFEPFYSTQNRVSMVGLGLWVSDQIVRAHGGRIHVRSIPGKGSLFIILLPVKEKGNVSMG